MANATTYERYSHEGQTQKKKRKKYIEKLKKQKESEYSSRDFGFQAKKFNDHTNENSSISENQQTSNTLSNRLIDDNDSSKFKFKFKYLFNNNFK